MKICHFSQSLYLPDRATDETFLDTNCYRSNLLSELFPWLGYRLPKKKKLNMIFLACRLPLQVAMTQTSAFLS